VPVFLDRNAFEGADLIVPINRVKVHTDFTGPIESGLMKMIAIGLGKQKGADAFHRQGFAVFDTLIPEVATYTIARAPIPFGIALIENGSARLRHIEAVPAERIATREPELLVMSTEALARLPFATIDVLILDDIGKDVSGLGMDSNVVGRYYSGLTGMPPVIQRIVVRDLTAATQGNAVGIGMADVALRRAVEKIDYRKTYMNTITAKTPEGARVPITVDTDREALSIALACCVRVTPESARIVRARDTKHLELLYVSASLLPDLVEPVPARSSARFGRSASTQPECSSTRSRRARLVPRPGAPRASRGTEPVHSPSDDQPDRPAPARAQDTPVVPHAPRPGRREGRGPRHSAGGARRRYLDHGHGCPSRGSARAGATGQRAGCACRRDHG